MRMGSLLIVLVASLATLAGCGRGGRDTDAGIATMRGEALTFSRRGLPDARVVADGTLTIGDKAVPVTPEQRAGLADLYRSAAALLSDALATGKAGAAVGAEAASAVVNGLATGDTSQIGAKVEAKAADVEASAEKVCRDAAAVHAAQSAIASTLPAFRPYARANAGIVHCTKSATP